MSDSSPSFCIIGAGMSGLLMAIRLQRAGYKNFTILEKAASLGGTWRENTYPGVACDVPAYYYSYSFMQNASWSRKFAPGAEILGYFQGVAEKYSLLPHIRFNKAVAHASFDGEQWELVTEDGDKSRVDFIISACGILHQPVLPPIEGLETFQGPSFHSARWDHGVALAGKKIGVIGTGSTGVQMMEPLSDKAARVALFQRTAQWVMPVQDKVYTGLSKFLRHWVPGLARLQYQLHKRTFEAFTQLVLKDGWQRKAVRKYTRANLNGVEDTVLRQRLTPDYEPGCKRLVMSDSFYQTMQRENVELVTEPIAGIEARGVRTADGVLHELDILVLATGFNPQAFMRPMELVNQDGVSLSEVWKYRVQAYRTVALPDFPNFFMLLGPNSPVGNFSVIAAAEAQAGYILQCIGEKIRHGAMAIAPSIEATESFNKELVEAMKGSIWLTGCQSWYLDADGNPVTWPWTPQRFYAELEKPDFADYRFSLLRHIPDSPVI
jgi:cation diffusion facilitator CzcD-associated flavoprotein CzcO